MPESEQFCTFRLAEHWIAIPVEQVQEVLHNFEVTPVPLAPAAVSGLINLRGQIVMTIDLRRRLDFPQSDSQTSGANIIVQAAGELVGLVVDAMGDVQRVSQAQFEVLPETVRDQSRALMKGCYKLKKTLLLALDVDKVAVLA